MKFQTSSAEFFRQITIAARISSTRSAVQALSGIQIAAVDGSIDLRATDGEVGLRLPLVGTAEREGTAVLPARLLLDVARALPGTEVSVELRTSEGDVEIISGSAQYHVRTLRGEDFPTLPVAAGTAVVLPAAALVETIRKVERSASRDETRPILTGVLVSATGTELKMVATDSYRLSLKTTILESPIDGQFEANVPARALAELARLVDVGSADTLTISRQENQVVFAVGGAALSSRLIDGQFPNYRQLLPDAYEHNLILDAKEIQGVVRRMSLMAQKNAPLRLHFSDGELTVSAQTPDVGEASESLPLPFAGESFEIGFNPEFLRDGFESVESEQVRLRLISPLRPGMIEAGDDSGFQYLIMPIRLNV